MRRKGKLAAGRVRAPERSLEAGLLEQGPVSLGRRPAAILTTRYGDRCEVLRPGTKHGEPALVRRLADGLEMELHWNDCTGGGQALAFAFYGIVSDAEFSRMIDAAERRLGGEDANPRP